ERRKTGGEMSESLSLSEEDLAPLLDSDALTDHVEDDPALSTTPAPHAQETGEQATLLRKVASETVSLFDLPHRSVSSTVTMCPSMHFSWHNVSAHALDEGGGGGGGSHSRSSSLFNCLERKSSSSSSSSAGETSFDVEKRPEQKKWILNEVFGVAQPGEVLAIMGSSGAGKTTLLNVLAHRNTKGVAVDGAIKVNGLRVTREFMRKISAYVEQEDAFIGSLTVREQLRFVASLRMGKKYSRADQERRVESVMKDLGLLPSADTVIKTKYSSRLSGGEKKRLSFAAEILTSPPILLCDEPTSGLDAFLAFQVVSVLKSLARRKGMTILLTIHQPSSQVFALFDRVYLMAEGRIAYSGTPEHAKETWMSMGRPLPLNFNPADHYINTLAITNGKEEMRQRREVKRLCDSFAISKEGRSLQKEARTGEVRKDSEHDEIRSSEQGQLKRGRDGRGRGERTERYKSTWFQQLCSLTWRVYKTIIRDPSLLATQFTEAIIIAVLTGIIYIGTPLTQKTVMNVNGAIWQNIVNQNFLFNFSAMHAIIAELPTFNREHISTLYRVDTYFLARNIAEMIPYTIYSVTFSTILYWMSGMVADFAAFAIYLLVSALIMHIAISFSYLVSCIFSSRAVAATVLPVFTVPALAFSGFYINASSLPIYFLPLRYLSYFSYAYEALAVNQWTRIDSIPDCSPSSPSCHHNGMDVLNSLSFHPSNLYPNIAALAAMVVVIRILAFLALYVKSRRH
ncbi:hypothetical protein PFISCL1PPCAC_8802, partial [Pristionchus fissidentatus]